MEQIGFNMSLIHLISGFRSSDSTWSVVMQTQIAKVQKQQV